MMWLFLAIAVIAVLAAFVVWVYTVDDMPIPATVFGERLRREVLITLDTKEAFRGVLFELDKHAVVLRSASAIDPSVNGGHMAVDGEIVLPVARIAYYQFT